jgi:hypothetical protein
MIFPKKVKMKKNGDYDKRGGMLRAGTLQYHRSPHAMICRFIFADVEERE